MMDLNKGISSIVNLGIFTSNRLINTKIKIALMNNCYLFKQIDDLLNYLVELNLVFKLKQSNTAYIVPFNNLSDDADKKFVCF